MAINTGWQYNPNQNPLDQTQQQSALDANPSVKTDNGNASASSPFLSATLRNSSDGWAANSQNITSMDLQAANNQTAMMATKAAQDNYKASMARLSKLNQQAEKAGQLAQAKAAQWAQTIEQNMHSSLNGGYGGYNYGAGGGTGPAGSARGLSAEGQSQLAIARADGYNLSASNYDRTYNYNNQYSAMRNDALSQAYSWLGTHYVLDGETKQVNVDCSGLVQAIYSKLGFSVPLHSATNEKNTIPGVRTSFSNLQPGDLVCWKDGSHIAIYAGNGQIIEAANTRVGTVRRALWDDPNNVVGIHLTFADENTARGQRL